MIDMQQRKYYGAWQDPVIKQHLLKADSNICVKYKAQMWGRAVHTTTHWRGQHQQQQCGLIKWMNKYTVIIQLTLYTA